MPRTMTMTTTPRCRRIFAGTKASHPLGYHLAEDLLEARAGSMFPTNGAGTDEDVNVYLVHLLGTLLTARPDARVVAGDAPLFHPPSLRLSRRERAAWYRANADHRLLHLGLFGRGDALRRRRVPWAQDESTARIRDLATIRSCYQCAADLMRGRAGFAPALVAVLDKLVDNCEDYIHVLGAAATRRFGLGAQLGENDLTRLLPPPEAEDAAAVDALLAEPAPGAALDELLDLWMREKNAPTPQGTARLRRMAAALDVTLPAG